MTRMAKLPSVPQDNARAADRGDLLHVAGGHSAWKRRFEIRIHGGDPDTAGDAGHLEFADGVDGQRTVDRNSRRGRLLRLGDARHGAILGISGSLALIRRQHVRHGALSHALRRLPGSLRARATAGERGIGIGFALLLPRVDESAGRQDGGREFAGVQRAAAFAVRSADGLCMFHRALRAHAFRWATSISWAES